ncbi:hypothetical protein [Pseudomonas capsici]|nr:hypothetical protein [Pseudomonas capsici]MCV4286245.1 hypothetical protein [Pseudomonas capsici]
MTATIDVYSDTICPWCIKVLCQLDKVLPALIAKATQSALPLQKEPVDAA